MLSSDNIFWHSVKQLPLDMYESENSDQRMPLLKKLFILNYPNIFQGPVVQNVVSLTSSLVVKMLAVLVAQYLIHRYFLLKKCEQLLQMQKLLTFFSKNISIITKTYLYNFDPLKPHFYNRGLQGYTLFFLFLLKHRLWVFVRTASPRRF